MKKALLSGLALVLIGGSAWAQVSVSGYTRKDGTYVAPHVRSSPNSTAADNYSTKGNVNPYTGAPGTKNPEPTTSLAVPYVAQTSPAPLTATLATIAADESPIAPVVPKWASPSKSEWTEILSNNEITMKIRGETEVQVYGAWRPRIWVMLNYQKLPAPVPAKFSSTVTLYVVDCGDRKYAPLQSTAFSGFDASGTAVSSQTTREGTGYDWKYSIPDSVIDGATRKACRPS